MEPAGPRFGDAGLYNAGYQINADLSFVNIQDIQTLAREVPPQYIHLRARLQSTRSLGGLCILTLRQNIRTVAGVLQPTPEGAQSSTSFPIDREDLKWVAAILPESVVDVYGYPTVSSSSQQPQEEIQVRRVVIVSAALETDRLEDPRKGRSKDESTLQFRLEPLFREQRRLEQQIFQTQTPPELRVRLKSILQQTEESIYHVRSEHEPTYEYHPGIEFNRSFRLRSKYNQAVHRLRSKLLQSIHKFFHERDYIEIHTPKLLECETPTWDQFSVVHHGRSLALENDASRAHETAMMANLGRVYEVGPGFSRGGGWRPSEKAMLDFTSESSGSSWMDHIRFTSSFFAYLLKDFASTCKDELEIIRRISDYSPVTLSHPLSDSFARGETIPIMTWSQLSDRFRLLFGENYDAANVYQKERQAAQMILSSEGSSLFIISNHPAVEWFDVSKRIEPDPDHPGFLCHFLVILNGQTVMRGQRKRVTGPISLQIDCGNLCVEDLVAWLLRLSRFADACLYPKTDRYAT
eukprot:TRINITY_DN13407_c0_g1_i1.p1 TRINITY_DN13407_c0_g1~~TRINITY_DN13407_c0_g1_i1.p1  ORF type:complete len:522 (-),score=51.13 TRINITY_DN13407_c0_g1_i1:240-1805(-)